jgi:hypothetical protein
MLIAWLCGLAISQYQPRAFFTIPRNVLSAAGDGNYTCNVGQIENVAGETPTCEKLCSTVNCAQYNGANGMPMVAANTAGSSPVTCANDGSDCQAQCCVPGMHDSRSLAIIFVAARDAGNSG